MKQMNESVIAKFENDREPSWCVLCDAKDRCDSCDQQILMTTIAALATLAQNAHILDKVVMSFRVGSVSFISL